MEILYTYIHTHKSSSYRQDNEEKNQAGVSNFKEDTNGRIDFFYSFGDLHKPTLYIRYHRNLMRDWLKNKIELSHKLT